MRELLGRAHFPIAPKGPPLSTAPSFPSVAYQAFILAPGRDILFQERLHLGKDVKFALTCLESIFGGHIMKLLLIGATGTIGQAIAAALSQRHEVVAASRNSGEARVDITDPSSIGTLFEKVGPVDGVISAAGAARRKPIAQMQDEDFEFSLHNKLMGQVNVVREGLQRVRDGGVIVVTSGQASRSPYPGSGIISLVNAGLEGFARAAALEAPRGIRVNAVSPPSVAETLSKLGLDATGGLPASLVAQAYVRAVETPVTGKVIEPDADGRG